VEHNTLPTIEPPPRRPRPTWQAPPRDVLPGLEIRRAPGLFLGNVRGRPFAHNPQGHEALALLSPRALQLLHAADGRTAADIAQTLASDPEDMQRWLDEVPLLLRNGFVLAPEVQPWRPTGKSERVFNTWLHLTNACNLACPYCYIHKSSAHMTEDVATRVLRSIEATAASGQVDRVHVRFAGGEPMLRFQAMQQFFTDATSTCEKHGVKFSAAVLTNGTVVPPGATAWLVANGVQVSVSMDGLGELQDVMRPVKSQTGTGGGSFERLQAGLDAYFRAGIRPYVLITVGDSNLDGLPALTSWLLERKLWFRYSLVRDLEWGEGLLDDRHGAEESRVEGAQPGILAGESLRRMQRVFGLCYDLIEGAVARGEVQGFRSSHKFCDLEPWRPIAKACGAGDSYLAIAESGEISPCQAALHHPGTQPVRPESLLTQARAQTQFTAFRRESGNPTCNACRWKPSCAGGCPLLLYRREGHVDGRSPYCEVFRAVLPRILRIAALELVVQQAKRLPPLEPRAA
jgi:uncharacterized protein